MSLEGISADARASRPLRGARVAVVIFSHYPSDPRPRRAAEALARAGMRVDVIAAAGDRGEPRRQRLDGVDLLQLPVMKRRGGKFAYLWQYGAFLTCAFGLLAWRSLSRRYRLVHVHNMPDFLVFSAIVPKLLGAKLLLDLHDPMPELMMTIFGGRNSARTTRMLERLERLSTGYADAVITVNEACRQIFARRSCAAGKVHVVMNTPDEQIFRLRPPAPVTTRPSDARCVLMYHGSLVERHGLDVAVAALALLRPHIGNIELRVYGRRTTYLNGVLNSLAGTPEQSLVHYHGERDLPGIVDAIDACTIGLIPNRRSIFTEINTPTRIFEYLSRGKPVIAPMARGILDYFSSENLFLFELGNAEDLARQIRYIWENPEASVTIVARGQEVLKRLSWSNEQARFLRLVNSLLGTVAAPEAPGAVGAAPVLEITK